MVNDNLNGSFKWPNQWAINSNITSRGGTTMSQQEFAIHLSEPPIWHLNLRHESVLDISNSLPTSTGLLLRSAPLSVWCGAACVRCTPDTTMTAWPRRGNASHYGMSYKASQKSRRTQTDQLRPLSKHPCTLGRLLCEENGLNVSELCESAIGSWVVFSQRQ